jgi:alpha-L-rhamnosidase
LFKYMALMTNSKKYAVKVFDEIARDWGYMLTQQATSFWETLKGAADFDNAGSLCHGWSAIPIYFYYSYVLGVRPTKPGFLEFVIDVEAPGFYQAKGTIPTPYGNIEVEWNRICDAIEIKDSYPEKLRKIEI